MGESRRNFRRDSFFSLSYIYIPSRGRLFSIHIRGFLCFGNERGVMDWELSGKIESSRNEERGRGFELKQKLLEMV